MLSVVANRASAAAPNTFGLANLELGDNLLHLVFAVWAFAVALMTPRDEMGH